MVNTNEKHVDIDLDDFYKTLIDADAGERVHRVYGPVWDDGTQDEVTMHLTALADGSFRVTTSEANGSCTTQLESGAFIIAAAIYQHQVQAKEEKYAKLRREVYEDWYAPYSCPEEQVVQERAEVHGL